MNELIENFLSEYIINPDPQYAVLLKGEWGCGKTHFIKNWLKKFEHNDSNDNMVILEPIYVSTYGMTSIEELKIAIDREINPFFYSKTGKLIKNVGKIIGKIALKTNIDIDDQGHNETTFSTSLDSFALFKADSKEISGLKLLVFDDIERCQIDMKQLLGFINGFVEQCGCHVIVVGDEDKLRERKKDFDEFKEKTIGREFKILPGITSAVDYFLSEVPVCDYLHSQRDFIIQCFIASKYNNLRILRQCLYDFKNQLSQIDDYANDSPFLHNILGSYIAIYFEYANNKELVLNWEGLYQQAFLRDDDDLKNKIHSIQRKYEVISKSCDHSLFLPEYVTSLVAHISNGEPIVEYLKKHLSNSTNELLLWDKRQRFIDMTQVEFDNTYKLSIELATKQGGLDNYQLGVTVAYLSYFHAKGIRHFDQAYVSRVKKELQNRIENTDKLDDLYALRKDFFQGCNYVEPGKCGEPLNDIVEFFECKYNNKKELLPDKMQLALRTLSDTNVYLLQEIDASSYPDRSGKYENRPIFAKEDAIQIFNSLKAMSNKSRNTFASFLAHHYEFGVIFSNDTDRYKADLPVLENLKSLVDKEIESTGGLDGYVFKLLSRDLSRCIKRAEGAAKI